MTVPTLNPSKKRFPSLLHRDTEMFVWGIIVGILLLTIFQTFTGKDLTFLAQGYQPASNIGVSAPDPSYAQVDTSKLTIRLANTKGPADAPVTIVEFSDFQCPYCRRSFETVVPQILKNYVAQGKVRFVYKHFAFLGQESIWAAEASECAADQGKFWEYHDELFKQAGMAGGENAGSFTKDGLIQYADALKLDMPRFTNCILGDLTLSRVNQDLQEGHSLNVRSTPTFFVNKTMLIGAQPWDTFVNAIDAALKP